jgi:hypothetical protein
MNNIIWVSILLALSTSINVFIFWYLKQLINKFSFFSTNIGNLHYNLHTFRAHLKKIYEMELFYGEPTLESLLEHIKEVEESMTAFMEIFNLNDTQEYEEWEWFDYGVEKHDSEEQTQEEG